MRYVFLLILLFEGVQWSTAQTALDAFRFSQQNVGGSARFVGVGGSMGALGADFSVLNTNPAGLGTYRKSEFMVSPGFLFNTTEARLEGVGNISFSQTENKLNLNNIGVVFYSRPKRPRWKSFNFGIGYTKIANFYGEMNYEGETTGSMADSYAEEADGLQVEELDAFGAFLAYQAGAIYLNSGVDYMSDFENYSEVPVFRSESIATEGYINELVFSFAGNYDNKLMVGATFGVPLIERKQRRSYTEQDSANDDIPIFNSLSYQETLSTSGVGLNAKIGVIYRVNQMVRVGGAIHTPTAMSLTDKYQNSVTYNFIEPTGSGGVFTGDSPDGTFNYRLRTPWRYFINGAVIIKKFGFVSAEVEYVDFGQASFNFARDNRGVDFSAFETSINNSIENNFQSVLKLKLGAEYAYKIWRLRVGYTINGAAFADENTTTSAVSLGMGLRKQRFYLDVAYRLTQESLDYLPYTTTIASQPIVNTTNNNNDIILTLGFRF